MHLKNRPVTLATALLALASLTGCDEPQSPDGSPSVDFTFQVLHTSDQESELDATDAAPRFSAVLRKLEQELPGRTLKLASGDLWLPGVFFNAGGDPAMSALPEVGRASAGRADIAIVNELGFHAASFGNHEFDSGTREIRNILAADRQWSGTKFPYLSANLDFSNNEDLASLVTEPGQVIDAANPGTALHNKIAASVVFDVDGRKVGVVGATTPQLPRISSPGTVLVRPADPADYDALAAEIQPHVDALRNAGIDKIILMSHMQRYAIEVDELPRRLEGVDIIVAGGNHSVWADVDDVLFSGDTRVAEYPQWQTSKTGEPVAVLNVASNWRYVGRFLAHFDASGRLVREKYDPVWNGAHATDEAGVQRVGASALVDPEVQAIGTAVKNVVLSKDGNVVGRTQVYLNGLRASVRTEETNLGNLTNDANLWYARQTDASTVIALKNGGGIRDSIGTVGTGATPSYGPPAANPAAEKPEGGISQLDIENSLRFNNDLVLVTVTAEQLEQVLEHSVAAVAPGVAAGQFPQVSGLRFEYDASRTAQQLDGEGTGTITVVGERIRKAEVVDAAGNVVDTLVLDGVLQGDATRTFRLVTLGFLARRNGDNVDVGGDNYPFPRFEKDNPTLFNAVSLDTDPAEKSFSSVGHEQKAFADYLSAMYPVSGEGYALADTAMDADTRIKRLDP